MFTLEQRKRLFAEQYLATPNEVYLAGTTAWPDDPTQGLKLALAWATDPEVLKYCEELRNAGSSANVPQKDQVVKELIEMGRNIRAEMADRIKAFELASKIMGYIAPPQTNIKNTVVNSRVMVLKDHGDEWEKRCMEQQAKLIEGHAISDDDDPAPRYQ